MDAIVDEASQHIQKTLKEMMGKYKVNNKQSYEGRSSNSFENQYMKDEFVHSSDALNFRNVVDVPLGSMR